MKHLPTKLMLLTLTGASILADVYFTLIKKDADTQAATTQVATTQPVTTQSSNVQNSKSQDTNQDTSQDTQTTTSSTSDQTTSSGYQDGTYTGSSTSTRWGDVQVQVTISGGQLTAVDVLSYPTRDRKSQSINQQVLPTYKQEALDAQSSSIQLVSGATETYNGFTGSLQDALNQALS